MRSNFDKDFKSMVVELEEIISDHIYLYFTKHFKDEAESGILINLAISGTVSTLVNVMKTIARNSDGDSDSVKKNVDLFINKLLAFIEQDHKMEVDKVYNK